MIDMKGKQVVMLAIVLLCLTIGGLFVYKNFFVSKTEKASIVEEKVEEKKEILKEQIVFPAEEEVIPEKEIPKKEEVVETLEETPIDVSAPEVKKEVMEIVEKEKIEEIALVEEEIVKPPIEKEISLAKDAWDIEEITGLIIEETMTKIGYEFYENFFSLWEAPKGITGYNIYINEKASPMWGSLVYVNVNNTLVWNRVLRPRSEDIEEAAKNSIEVVKNYLFQYEEIKRQLENVDMIGDGIW